MLNGFIFLVILSFSGPFSAAEEMSASLDISTVNNPPVLLFVIPNQTIPHGTNLTNAFLLTDYFADDGGNMTFFVVNATDVLIEIDGSTSAVSFYGGGFVGVNVVYFIASDGLFNTTSNPVFVNVMQDTEAPRWNSPRKTPASVTQNNVVNLSVDWTDNVALGYYFLSINQGGGWINGSIAEFSGRQNRSLAAVIVSAAGGTNVSWYFYAFDYAGNMNASAIQTFTVETSPVPPENPGQGTGGGGAGSAGTYSTVAARPSSEPIKKVANFTVEKDSYFLRLNIGETGSFVMKITNIGNVNLTFDLSTLGAIASWMRTETTNFSLSPGQSRAVTYVVQSEPNSVPDLHYGNVMVTANGSGSVSIPVVVELHSPAPKYVLEVVIAPKTKNVVAGEMVYANITLINHGDLVESSGKLYIALRDFGDHILDSYELPVVFEKNDARKTFFMNLTVPSEGIMPGDYIFFGRFHADNETAVGSDLFTVGTRFNLWGFIQFNLLFLFLIFLSIIAALFMVRHRRYKERIRLLNLYLMAREMKRLLDENKVEEALKIYVRIKSFYGEPVSKIHSQSRDILIAQMKAIYEELQKSATLPSPQKVTAPPQPAPAPQAPSNTESQKATAATAPKPDVPSKAAQPDLNKTVKKEEPKHV